MERANVNILKTSFTSDGFKTSKKVLELFQKTIYFARYKLTLGKVPLLAFIYCWLYFSSPLIIILVLSILVLGLLQF